MLRRYWFVVFLLIFTSMVFAGEEEKEALKMEEVVVTATRTEKDVQTAPGSVNVVTKKETEMRNIKTVDAALNTLPGVYNRRQSLMDTLSAISLGGIPEQKRTLVLRDGVALNNAYTGDVNFGGLSTEDIERIEVVRGPFSSLYGGYAMGGVVNIITRMPEKRELTLKGGYGSSWNRNESLDDLYKYYLSYGDKIDDKLRLLLSYGYSATNGYAKTLDVQTATPTSTTRGWQRTTTNQGAKAYVIGDKGDNTWWNDNLAFKAGYDFSSFSKLLVSYMQGRYNYSYKDPNTYLINAAGDKTYYYNGADKAYSYVSGSGQREQSIYNASYEAEIGVVKAKLNLGLTDENTNWYTTPGSTTATKLTSGPGTISSTPNQNFNSDIQFTVPLWSRNIVTFGGSYKQGSANTEEHSLTNWTEEKSTNYLTYNAGGKDQTFSLFLQDEILIFDNLTAYLGFREDWWRTYDGYANQFGSGAFTKTYDARTADAFSPKLAIVYKPFSRTTVRTSAGQAFRAPSVYELYRTWVSSGGVTYNGNPDLKPETVRSWDIGISQGLWKGAKVGVTYFENYMEDLIYRKTVTATRQDYINAGKADSKGATFEVEQRFDKWLRLFGNYTYTDARVRENSSKPTTVGKRLIHMPEQMANGGFELEWGAVSASVTGRYVGKRFSDDENKDTFDGVYTSYDPYFTADAKISCKIGQYVVLTLAVDNIADESHFDYYKAPGRLWFSELTLRF